MQIIPAIDIRNGKCVRLFQGDYAKETIYSDSPVNMALKWKKQGAKILHIVDLDGAIDGKPKIANIIKQIIEAVRLPIQVGGGIRGTDLINQLIESGVSKIILSTIVLENPELLKKIVNLYDDNVVVSLDVSKGKLMKKGWLQTSDLDPIQLINKLENTGVKTIIYTDISRDGTLTEPNYKMIDIIRKNTKMGLIIAGGISSIDQIKKLKAMKVDGVIIGKALYEGQIILKEVIKNAS